MFSEFFVCQAIHEIGFPTAGEGPKYRQGKKCSNALYMFVKWCSSTRQFNQSWLQIKYKSQKI
jgi:hypothetical protein